MVKGVWGVREERGGGEERVDKLEASDCVYTQLQSWQLPLP